MNYTPKEYYNELYRIFSCSNTLLTQTQTVKIGQCLRALAAGENIIYKLEDLFHTFRGNDKITGPLENFMHRYIDDVKKDDVAQHQPKIEQEVLDNGKIPEQSEKEYRNPYAY